MLVSSDQFTAVQRRSIRALITMAALACEAFVLFVLLMMALSASAALEPQATEADVQPRLELACEIGMWVVPVLVGVVAAWRKFWVITEAQVCLMLWLAWNW